MKRVLCVVAVVLATYTSCAMKADDTEKVLYKGWLTQEWGTVIKCTLCTDEEPEHHYESLITLSNDGTYTGVYFDNTLPRGFKFLPKEKAETYYIDLVKQSDGEVGKKKE